MYLISFCNLGTWCSRYCLGVLDDAFHGFAWLDPRPFVLPDADTGATGLARLGEGVLVCIQSSTPRLIWLDRDLRLRHTFPLSHVRDPHSVAVRGHEALIACAATNRLLAVDLRRGTEHCVFAAHPAEHDVVHLNGVTLWEERPIVSLFGPRDTAGSRAHGSVLDVERGDILADALAEPHSPRMQSGTLTVLASATGEIVRVRRGNVERVPIGGYLRGLLLEESGAVIGRSAWRAGRRPLGRTAAPASGDDPHGHPWQRPALIRRCHDDTTIETDLGCYGPELYDVLRLDAPSAAASLFHDAAARRLDALQEAQVRLGGRKR